MQFVKEVLTDLFDKEISLRFAQSIFRDVHAAAEHGLESFRGVRAANSAFIDVHAVFQDK